LNQSTDQTMTGDAAKLRPTAQKLGPIPLIMLVQLLTLLIASTFALVSSLAHGQSYEDLASIAREQRGWQDSDLETESSKSERHFLEQQLMASADLFDDSKGTTPASPTSDKKSSDSKSEIPTESGPSLCPSIVKTPIAPLLKKLPTQDPCMNQGTSLVVLTDLQYLFLCQNGKSQRHFDVALGRGGLDKRKSGDCKTPIGTYSLAQPRRSTLFAYFVPIGYPTAEQAALGYTGSAVGIHGPASYFDFMGGLTVSLNWTRGCIAVESSEAINSIANFVKISGAKSIKILPPDPAILAGAKPTTPAAAETRRSGGN